MKSSREAHVISRGKSPLPVCLRIWSGDDAVINVDVVADVVVIDVIIANVTVDNTADVVIVCEVVAVVIVIFSQLSIP